MKTLSLEQMEVNSAEKLLACVSQVASGMGTLWRAAVILAFGTDPVGRIVFGIRAISFAAGAASGPYACG